jgi:hypothetical protein
MSDAPRGPLRVKVADLIDVTRVRRDGRAPTPAELRAALPRGWVLDDDGEHAVRDRRLLFSQGWVLIVGMVVFGAVALGLFWSTFPRGWRGLTRLGLLIVAFVVIGGIIAPLVTRALHRR